MALALRWVVVMSTLAALMAFGYVFGLSLSRDFPGFGECFLEDAGVWQQFGLDLGSFGPSCGLLWRWCWWRVGCVLITREFELVLFADPASLLGRGLLDCGGR